MLEDLPALLILKKDLMPSGKTIQRAGNCLYAKGLEKD
jgi:hypothetical protein